MQPCIPSELPVENLDWKKLTRQIGEASASLARYDGMLQALPNPSVLLSPITANEAVLSSRIEGTQATLEEVLQQDAGILQSGEKGKDIEEIANYRAALRMAEDELLHRPLSLSLIKAIHQRLMQGVRGEDKSPGEIRNVQNWIGSPGCKIEEARFVPPDPLQLTVALENWIKYINSSVDDPILQVAIAHAQFEILHPFKDGNGRIGRMIIPLLLFQRNSLSRPMFYLSEVLEANREAYYDKLLTITKNDNWQNWIDFFFKSIIEQSEKNFIKVKKMFNLYDALKQKFIGTTHSQFATTSLDAFFSRPIINSTDFQKEAGIENRVTANDLLRQLVDANLITLFKKGTGRMASVYALPELINIVEGKNIF